MHSDAGGSVERLSRASPQRLGQAKLELLGSAAKDLAAGPGNPIITAIFSLACSSQNCDELFERWGHQTRRMSSFDAAAWCLLVFSWSRKWLTCNEAMVRNSADTCPAALQAAQLTEKSPVSHCTASSHGNCSVHRLPKRAHALCADIPGSLGRSSVQRALAEKNLSLRTKFLSRGPLESEGRLNKPQRCGLSKELETFEHREFCVPRNPRIVVHSTVRSAVVCGDNLWKPETLWTNGVCGKNLSFFPRTKLIGRAYVSCGKLDGRDRTVSRQPLILSTS